MDVICVERTAWALLKQRLSLLTTEVEEMRATYCPKPNERWLDSQDVCRILGLSKRTLQGYRNSGKIPHSMLGGKIFFKESDINDLLKSGLKKR